MLTIDEAAVKLAELRDQEQRLIVELANVAKRTAIMEEWQAAIEMLTGCNVDRITSRLNDLVHINPVAFRRLLSLVFERNGLRVTTKRIKGSLKWCGVLDGYQLTEAMMDMQKEAVSFDNSPTGKV